MGAPSTGMQAGDQASAEALLGAFKTIKASERRKHASVLNYWLSIRGDKEFPPLHDLDPLELSDAGPNSALLELISGGHDAEIRHLGEALRGGQDWPERIMDAPTPSILGCIAKKLPIVAISRDFPERLPKCVFQTDAGLATINYNGVLDNTRFHGRSLSSVKPSLLAWLLAPAREHAYAMASDDLS